MTPTCSERSWRALARDVRHFRILVRHSFGRLIEAALASRETDATQFAIWGTALVATLPFFFAAKMMGTYSFLARRPDVLERVVISHRLFFVIYAMLAASLLAAAMWDALFPDRQDQEIVGVLPVRARTLAAARLSAALCAGGCFVVAITLPCALMYTLNVAAGFRSAPLIGWWGGAFAGHVAAMIAAGMFTLAALLALRGLAVLCVGAEAAQRAAAVLQLVTMILLVEAFIFLPSVVPALMGALAEGTASALMWPPLWFLGLYAEFAGPPAARVPGLAPMAVASLAGATLAAIAAYLLPASWNARAALEARMKDRASRLVGCAERVARPVLRAPAARAVFAFVLASLARSRRHALIIATYLGLAVAVAGIRLTAATLRGRPLALDAPADYLLALPLVVTFFLVFGLRAAFAVPTDLEANWTFRIVPARSTQPHVSAVALVMVLLAVLPVTAMWLLVTMSLWGQSAGLAAAMLHAATGVALVELAVIDCRAVPFTCDHVPAANTVKISWAWFLIALHLYAFRLDDLQRAAMNSSYGIAWYVCGTLAVVTAARLYRYVKRASWSLRFDAPVEKTTETLNLSQALG